jgi:hypothetical protein
MSTGSRTESANMVWSAFRSSRVGRSSESKCSSHCGFEGLLVGAGAGRCFLSLMVSAPFSGRYRRSPIVLDGHAAGKCSVAATAAPNCLHESTSRPRRLLVSMQAGSNQGSQAPRPRAEHLRVRDQVVAELTALDSLDARFRDEDKRHEDQLREAHRGWPTDRVTDDRTPPQKRQCERAVIEERLSAGGDCARRSCRRHHRAGAPATGTTSSRREFSRSARPASAATQLGG